MSLVVNTLPYFVVIFIGNILYNICFGKLINQKFNINFRNILITITCSLLIFAINNIHIIWIKMFISLIIGTFNDFFIFSCKFKESFIGYMIIYILIVLFELFYTNLFGVLNIISDSNSAIYLNFIKLTISFIICISVYVGFIINKIVLLLKKLFNILYKNTNLTNIVFLIFVVASILSLTNVETFYHNGAIYLLLSLIIIFAILFTLIIKTTTNVAYLKDSNNKLAVYNDNYGKFLKEYKLYKHNIKHKLKSVKAYGNKKVNELIDDILEEETTFAIKNNDLYNLPNGIKGAMAERLYNVDLDVLVYNKIKGDPFKNLSARSFNETSTCLGIALDNAVEASELVKNPVIVIDLNEDDDNIYIKVGNKFKNNIDFIELGNLNYSTKNRGSGFGLFSIMKSKRIKEKISIINDFFYIELKISK